MKKEYTKPSIESEGVFEVLAAGCTLNDPGFIMACDPLLGGTQFNTK